MAHFDIVETPLNGLVVLQPSIFHDTRGQFLESFNARDFAALGLPTDFVQDNLSVSQRHVLRGLHFQWDKPMGKLLQVCFGHIQLVELDIRPDSPTCGKYWTTELDDRLRRLVWIPPGFANGFLVLSDCAIVHYKCTSFYNPAGEGVIRWDDPALGIAWRLEREPVTSEKDARGQLLAEWLRRPESRTFSFHHDEESS